MDSSSQVADSNHIIMELGNKSVKNSSISFQNSDASILEDATFTNCNGNSSLDHEACNLTNGVGMCNDDCDRNSCNNTKRTNSSQCNISIVPKPVCTLESNLSNLSIKPDIHQVESNFACNQCSESTCRKCDKRCMNKECANESSTESIAVSEPEPKSDVSPDSGFAQVNRNGDNTNKNEKEDNEASEIVYISYESEHQMPDIMKLIQKDLSEPYSIYTYRYFIHNWPHLCFLAVCKGKSVGAIVCKLDIHRKVIKRGYIAMLAVDESYRKHGIGSNLVLKAIRVMAAEGADEVVLETEITNQPALRLYENLGFVRDKRLFRYYLNGVDALRLKLWLR